MKARRGPFPQRRVGHHKSLDLARRQLESPIAEIGERGERLPHELEPQLFVREQLTDEQLNRPLGHGDGLRRCATATGGPTTGASRYLA
jgi:hypothetical protein